MTGHAMAMRSAGWSKPVLHYLRKSQQNPRVDCCGLKGRSTCRMSATVAEFERRKARRTGAKPA